MCGPRAFVNQSQFKAAIARAAKRLAPDVASIIPTLGDNSSGERAVFFMVILSDVANRREQLLNVTNQVSNTIFNGLEPLEQWGVLPISISAASLGRRSLTNPLWRNGWHSRTNCFD
jgi:hypothetical protein